VKSRCAGCAAGGGVKEKVLAAYRAGIKNHLAARVEPQGH